MKLRLLPLLLLVCPSPARAADLALTHARVYATPDAAPLDGATVLVHDDRIVAVAAGVAVPAGARVIDCAGKVVVAGFWNSHVHLTLRFANAADAPAAQLQSGLRDMLTRWGVTSVFDLGGAPVAANALRRRIERREVDGPRVYLAADLFPDGPNPAYLPREMALPKAKTAAEATALARAGLAESGDGLKLFTGVFRGREPVLNMSLDIARAATVVAHAARLPVFAHPQNHAGVMTALQAGVDVLAHTIPDEGRFSDDELVRMKAQHTALIPTLGLWHTVVPNADVTAKLVAAGIFELRQFARNGGVVLFGTDVGFTRQDDPTQELVDMAQALSWRDVLAALTSAPAAFFHAADRGRVAPGLQGDLVVLDGDPATDVRNLARVALTVRAGRVIYQRP